jgi:hypothetical protein
MISTTGQLEPGTSRDRDRRLVREGGDSREGKRLQDALLFVFTKASASLQRNPPEGALRMDHEARGKSPAAKAVSVPPASDRLIFS